MSNTRGHFAATVIANTAVCREHFRLTLSVPSFPPTDPGQFVQVWCRSSDAGDRELAWAPAEVPKFDRPESLGPVANLRRPFSLAGRRDGPSGAEIDLIHRIVGVGTDWLSRLRTGDVVSILGPLGNRFTLPGADGVAILVGGGVGIPPMIYLASRLDRRRGVAFVGAVSRNLLPVTITDDAPPPHGDSLEPLYNVAEFAAHGLSTVVCTDDGSYGARGFVTVGLETYLDRWFSDPANRERLVVYTCGPEPMMNRVAAITAARNIRCQVAVERAMACGMGTCQSCCVRIKKPDPAARPDAGPHLGLAAGLHRRAGVRRGSNRRIAVRFHTPRPRSRLGRGSTRMNREKFAWSASIVLLVLLTFQIPGSLAQRDDDYAFVRTLLEVRRQVIDNYVDPVDEAKLHDAAISGMLESLDPYSNYFPPAQETAFDEMLSGTFRGIGVRLETLPDGRFKVVSPIGGSPAERAGIRPGDLLLAVDDKPVGKIPFDELKRRISGPKGSAVSITVGRVDGTQGDLRDEPRRRSSVQRPG